MSVQTAIRYGQRVARSGEWTEDPPNTNTTEAWDVYHDATGAPAYQRQPWCGAALVALLVKGGWKDAPPQFISVYATQSWGEQHKRWRYGAKGLQPGDSVVLFGAGIHEGMARSAVRADGTFLSEEGNTSPGSEGSQFNGGTFALKTRHVSDVYGYAITHDLLGTGKALKEVPADAKPVAPQFRHEEKRGSLHLWERGPRVAELQLLLGLDDDGYYGHDTARAVAEAKRRRGLAAKGGRSIGPALIEALRRAHDPRTRRPTPRTVQRHDKGAAVRRAQRWLNYHGAKLTEDGDFGPKTLRAVRAFQKRQGLYQDGVVGPKTWRALLKRGGPRGR